MQYKLPNERKDGRAVVSLIPLTKAPIKIKNLTLKKKLKIIDTSLIDFKSQGLSALKQMTESELSKLIRDANDAYYRNNEPIMSDNEYDILIDYTKSHYPDNVVAKEGHTAKVLPICCDQKTASGIAASNPPTASAASPPTASGIASGIAACAASPPTASHPTASGIASGIASLPYQMWSMDKIKPDTDALSKWLKKYKGPYVLSCKVDGVSGLYTTEGPEPKLYTRGDGITGQDVSHIIPYLKLPQTKNITIRGEFIITKELFARKYAASFANPRNFVAGVINKKTIDADKYRDLSFVIYELIEPRMKPSEQMKFISNLSSTDIEVIQYIIESVANETLSELLIKWRVEYKYEIDGIICMNDAIYSRPSGNPDYAFAFKMVLSDQVAEAKVVDVIWAPSKDGYLKPRVQIEPIKLRGVDIEYATGFNASFIETNKIGVGALIRLIRSGDVIPHITDVIQPASEPLMPDPTTYEWNDTHVDIVLKDIKENQVVKEKNISCFFTSLDVEGLAIGNVKRIMASGYDTIPKILSMSVSDLLKVDGFKRKMADKVYTNIKAKVEEASLAELMHATNIFGRGFGTRKLSAILTHLPTILQPSDNKIKLISNVQGMGNKTAEKFVHSIDEFLQFMSDANLNHKLTTASEVSEAVESNPLYKKKYVMTGFRDKEFIKKMDALGAEQASNVSKNTSFVIVKSLDEFTGKVDEARKLNIPIMTPDQILRIINKPFQ